MSRLPQLGHGRLLLTRCSQHDSSNLCFVAKTGGNVSIFRLARLNGCYKWLRTNSHRVGLFFFFVILVKLRHLINNFWELQLPLAPCSAAYIWNHTGRRQQMENADFNATEINRAGGRQNSRAGKTTDATDLCRSQWKLIQIYMCGKYSCYIHDCSDDNHFSAIVWKLI